MRVTNNMLSQNMLRNLELANSKMALIQNRLSSGQAITKPSDDPVKISAILRMKSSISSMEQWKINTGEALAYLETTEGILGDMNSMLQRVRELTVQGASATNSISDRGQIAQEVDQLIDQFKIVANSQIGTKYIFSGTMVDTPPLSDAALPKIWEGNDKDFAFEVGPNLNMGVSVDGIQLFGISADREESSFFDALTDLSTALKNGDQPQLNQSLTDIDSQIDNVLSLRAELGAKTNRMYAVADQLDNSIINIQSNLADIQDADMADTIMEYQAIQNVYEAALSVGAKIIQPSLVDFIR